MHREVEGVDIAEDDLHVREALGLRGLQHLGRGIDAQDRPARHEFGQPPGERSIPAAQVEDALVSAQFQLSYQIAGPLALMGGVPFVVSAVPALDEAALAGRDAAAIYFVHAAKS
jgi:hypothetical protein